MRPRDTGTIGRCAGAHTHTTVARAAPLVLGATTMLACQTSSVVTCADGTICPANSACSDGPRRCIVPEQRTSCDGKDDGDACNYPGVPNGACGGGICVPAGCGNGVIEPGEICDDGNLANRDGCAADCLSDESCGNGLIDDLADESCDDGSQCEDGTACENDATVCAGIGDGSCGPRDGDDCRADCTSPRCGDGIVDMQFGEQCDCGKDPGNLPAGRCNTVNGDAPDGTCRGNCLEQRCGDGVVDVLDGEQCDDGNVEPGDGCSGACNREECGNGILDVKRDMDGFVPAEDCDDANFLSRDGCLTTCERVPGTWKQFGSAPARHWPASTYDAARGRVVMFGGYDDVRVLGDTWEWDGQSWIDATPTIG